METVTITGKVEGLYLGLGEEHFLTTPQEKVRVNFGGFEGDRHASMTMRSTSRTSRYPRNTMIRNSRQVTILSVEELAAMSEELGIAEIRPEWLGGNMLVSGIPMLTLLPRGTRLYFPDRACLVAEGLNQPCTGPGEVIQTHYPEVSGLAATFVQAALRRRGLVAWVERPGTISNGDRFEAALPEPIEYPYASLSQR